MQISVKVVPNAKRNEIKEEDGLLKVYTSSPAVDGKANKALVEVLASHYSVKKRQVSIVRGEKARNKVVKIIEE